MDVAALIDGTVALTVIGGAVWAIVALFTLALCRTSALADEAMEAYLAGEFGSDGNVAVPELYDAAAREWIAEARRAS